jgi:hypothetical protein
MINLPLIPETLTVRPVIYDDNRGRYTATRGNVNE